jgi:hypothetical protein
MAYEIIQPPFTLKFHEMSKQELINYASWFHGIAPERLAQLESAVQETRGYEAWEGSFRPESLDALGEWFAEEVNTRPRSSDEIAEIKARGEWMMAVPEVELTNRSFSLAIDVGIYVARMFEQNYPQQLSWKQFLDNKKFADYGQPVLTGFGPVPLNPIRIAVTLAYGLASRRQTGKRLREIYDYWARQVVGRPH